MSVAWIVDDDEEMGEAIQLMLQMMNFNVSIYKNARSAAKELIAGKRPDVIILDIMMPGVTGIDFLEFLRMRKEFRDVPIVMLSSETTDVQVDEAMEIGANGFVFKPVTYEELEGAISQAIAAH
jgi:DNA-binding response OmpR family regulator